MRFHRAIRIGLLLLLLSAAAGIAWSLFSRLSPSNSTRVTDLLSPDVQQRSTDFLHSEFKLGRLMFRVQARSHALSSEGLEKLEDVELVLHDENGEASDVVSGRYASFHVPSKRIEFWGDVRARISEGTQIRCEKLEADLNREEIRIRQAFHFVRGLVEGRAGTLLYRIPSRLLELGDGFVLTNPAEEIALEASGTRGIYDLGRKRFSLAEGAWLKRGPHHLEAMEINLWLSPGESVERVVASGDARFSTKERVFEGEEIFGTFDQGGALTDFQVLGRKNRQQGQGKAVFRQNVAGGEDYLEAERIVGKPFPALAGAPQDLLREFQAHGDVELESPRLGVEKAQAGFLRAQFHTSGEMENLDLRQDIELWRKSLNNGREWLKCGALNLSFDVAGNPERALATRDVELGAESLHSRRWITCARSLEVEFLGGTPARATGYENCVAELASQGQRLSMRAPWLRSTFENGLTKAVAVRGGVEFDFEKLKHSRTTRSDGADLLFDKGTLSRVTQAGDVTLETPGTAGTIQMTGERALFAVDSGTTRVWGQEAATMTFLPGEGVSAEKSVTSAAGFDIEQNSGRVTARQRVHTRVDRPDESLTISSGKMEVEPETGRVEYTDGPEVETGSTRVRGERVRFGGNEAELTVEGDVQSQSSLRVGESASQFLVNADTLTIGVADKRALYEGNVRARSEKFDLMAPSVELHFPPGSGDSAEGIQEIQAWGGVEIQEGFRKAFGDKAFYYPTEEKVVVTGEPARILDSNQGTASGRRLVFFLGEERLTVEGTTDSKP